MVVNGEYKICDILKLLVVEQTDQNVGLKDKY